jgi:hypothetical protein
MQGSLKIGNGQMAWFWQDTLLDKLPLATRFPFFYAIVRHKNISVANVLNRTPLNVSFTWVLIDGRWEHWLKLVDRLMEI